MTELPFLAHFQELQPFPLMIQEWFGEFAEAYGEYGAGAADLTGLSGQWADLYRKVMKLKRGMWDREGFDYLKRESAQEILKDLIGHAFLAWEMLLREESSTYSGPNGSKTTTTSPADSSKQFAGSWEPTAR